MNRGNTMPQFAAPDDIADADARPKPTLEGLFTEEEGPLLGFAYGYVKRREVAEELVQDGFYKLHQHWETVENPRAWIYKAVRNLCISYIRKHQRETVTDEVGSYEAHGDAKPDEQLSQLEAIGQVRLHLAELPAKDRELIRMKYVDDMRYADIGKKTGLTSGNVGYRLHHLLKNLATSLRNAGITGSQG
jgi:RNA polymerase sigma factor (sigma-70 family)